MAISNRSFRRTTAVLGIHLGFSPLAYAQAQQAVPQLELETMLSALFVLLALLAAACFYASVPHQRLWRRPWDKTWLRAAGSGCFVLSMLAASFALSFWAGFYAATTALMLGCVVLPYIDAWRSQRSRVDVG